mgnify:CR=1 FL=1
MKYSYKELDRGPGDTYRVQVRNKADYPIVELIICSQMGTGAQEAVSLMIGALEARNGNHLESVNLIGLGLNVLRKMFRRKPK